MEMVTYCHRRGTARTQFQTYCHHLLLYSHVVVIRKNDATRGWLPKRIIMMLSGKHFSTFRIRQHGGVDDSAPLIGEVTYTLISDAPGTIFGGDRSNTRCPRNHEETRTVLMPRQNPQLVITKPCYSSRRHNTTARANRVSFRWGKELNLRSIGQRRHVAAITRGPRDYQRAWHHVSSSGCARRWESHGVRAMLVLEQSGIHGCRRSDERGEDSAYYAPLLLDAAADPRRSCTWDSCGHPVDPGTARPRPAEYCSASSSHRSVNCSSVSVVSALRSADLSLVGSGRVDPGRPIGDTMCDERSPALVL